MTRSFAPALALACLLLMTPAIGQEGADPPPPEMPPSWYAQALARADAGLHVTNFWSMGPRMRAESVVRGHRIVTIVNGEWYYAYDAVGKTGVAIQRSPAARVQDRRDRRPFGNHLESLIEQGAEKVRTDQLMGRDVDIFRVTDSRGKRTLWVTRDGARLPLRIEIFSRKSGSTQYTDYLKWMQGLPIQDSFFEPEASVEIKRYTLLEYLKETSETGPIGPVPILYADLLHGPKGLAPK